MIETKHLILKQGVANDWKDLHCNLWQHPSAFQFLFSKPSPTEEAAKKRTFAYVKMQQEIPTEFFVYLKETSSCIGIAGIKQLSRTQYSVTDIALGPAFSGNGYGKEILNALCNLAFCQLNAEELLYCCFQENIPSIKLARSCGFLYVNSKPAELTKEGQEIILNHYRKSILK